MRDELFSLAPLVLVFGLGAVVLADATGTVHCEQHRIGVELELQNLARALDEHRAEQGHFPDELELLGPRFSCGSVPLDYWRRPFQYSVSASLDDYELWSLGEDGLPGGSGEAADVYFAR